MFTGLIETTGKVESVSKGVDGWRIVVEAPKVARKLKLGDSVSVSGVCLTALEPSAKTFAADLAKETVERTSLARLKAGAVVNLELPMKSGTPVGGHIVQGHVDGVAKLVSLKRIPSGRDWRLRLALPAALNKYVVAKGSIAIEGISLTVAKVEKNVIEIAVIPHTYTATNLNALKAGAPLNIEVDVLAKYAEKNKTLKPTTITTEMLMQEGF